jgi:hypothetical protein
MSFLADRSLTEVLASLATNIVILVLPWLLLLGLLIYWLIGNGRLLKFLRLWFFEKKKRASLKMEGDDFEWSLWALGTFVLIGWIYDAITSK